MKKETRYKVIAVLLPFFVLFLVELGLRMAEVGTNYQLFENYVNQEQEEYLYMNSDIGKKYFRNKDFHSDNQVDMFLKTKTDNTFRIFVQGASTVAGFPFYNGGSFPRMLKHRLAQTFPNKNIEVINTGITAVNSYTLLDFTDEIIEQKPDLVIIYAGHNEYYGALGVGSSSSFGRHPFIVRGYLSLKKLRVFQVLDKAYAKLLNRNTSPEGDPTLMEIMVEKQRIPINSKVYQAGCRQFKSNMDRILKKYKKHNIPVLVSTLVSNEKDTRPFISDSPIDTIQFLEFIKDGKPEAFELADHNALAAYTLGRYYLTSNIDSAIKYLHQAKELDLLRFRAPEEMNTILVNSAEKYDYQLVDMNAVFLDYSQQPILGDELLTEHIHPNVEGYFLMADAFYTKMKQLNLINEWGDGISFNEAYNDIPITRIDSLKGKLVIDNLKNSWPYVLTKIGDRQVKTNYGKRRLTFEELKARDIFSDMSLRSEAMGQAYEWYKSRKEYDACLRIAQSMIFDYPDQKDLYFLAGNMCLNLNEQKKATYYFLKYNQLDGSSFSAQQLATVYLQNGQVESAKHTLTQAINSGIEDSKLTELLQEIYQRTE